MRRLVLTLAVAAAIVSSAVGATIVWSDAPAAQPSADTADAIVWGS
jgi:hypothetical protein